MNKLKALLEMYAGTMKVAVAAAGVTHADGFGSMCRSHKSVMYSDCILDCDDDGNPYVYCDGGGSDN